VSRKSRVKFAIVIGGAALVSLGSGVLSGSGPAVPIALVGTVIDGTGRPPLIDGVVLLEGESIIAVGSRDDMEIPAEARVYELEGGTILPGFINAHVHNTHAGRALLEAWAREGVTTVRDLGAPLGATWWVRSDDPRLATVLSAGPIVTVPEGYPIAANGFPSLTVTSPQDARQKIQGLAMQGAEVIKISLESRAGPILTLEETIAVVETAHSLNLPVSVHVTAVSDLRQAVEAGVDDVAHMVNGSVPDELLAAMLRKGIAWVPTLAATREAAGTLRRFLDSGGLIAVGNDSGYLGFDVGMPMDEIESLARAGMTPLEILVAATRNGARVLRREATLGTLEPGKLADVLVVRGDPLADLEALSNPLLVVHRGVVIREGVLPRGGI
jgi:imidazolonepropionase-like amidohydrolase